MTEQVDFSKSSESMLADLMRCSGGQSDFFLRVSEGYTEGLLYKTDEGTDFMRMSDGLPAHLNNWIFQEGGSGHGGVEFLPDSGWQGTAEILQRGFQRISIPEGAGPGPSAAATTAQLLEGHGRTETVPGEVPEARKTPGFLSLFTLSRPQRRPEPAANVVSSSSVHDSDQGADHAIQGGSSTTSQEPSMGLLRKRDSDQPAQDVQHAGKNGRIRWTLEMHNVFMQVIVQMQVTERLTPKGILRHMGPTWGLTTAHIKSHLQKYRSGKYENGFTLEEQGEQRSHSPSVSTTAEPPARGPLLSFFGGGGGSSVAARAEGSTRAAAAVPSERRSPGTAPGPAPAHGEKASIWKDNFLCKHFHALSSPTTPIPNTSQQPGEIDSPKPPVCGVVHQQAQVANEMHSCLPSHPSAFHPAPSPSAAPPPHQRHASSQQHLPATQQQPSFGGFQPPSTSDIVSAAESLGNRVAGVALGVGPTSDASLHFRHSKPPGSSNPAGGSCARDVFHLPQSHTMHALRGAPEWGSHAPAPFLTPIPFRVCETAPDLMQSPMVVFGGQARSSALLAGAPALQMQQGDTGSNSNNDGGVGVNVLIGDALRLQMKMQSQLSEQLELQRQLQQSLTQHSSYIAKLMRMADGTKQPTRRDEDHMDDGR